MRFLLLRRLKNSSGTRSPWRSFRKALVGAVLGGIVFSVCAFAAEGKQFTRKGSERLCGELKRLQKSRVVMHQRALRGVEVADGSRQILDIDVDGDDVSDEIIWMPTGSASMIPADNTTLRIRFSSGGELAFEEARFHLVRHKGRIFIDAALFDSKGTRESGKKIFSLHKSGARLECVLVAPHG